MDLSDDKDDISLNWLNDMILENELGELMMTSENDLFAASDCDPEESSEFVLDTDKVITDNSRSEEVPTGTRQKTTASSRKMKRINPALKLKTPIAFQKDTDPSEIPIVKDGMVKDQMAPLISPVGSLDKAVCTQCGAIGVKHAFYTKQRRFCSTNCVRQFAEMAKKMDSSKCSSQSRRYSTLSRQVPPGLSNDVPNFTLGVLPSVVPDVLTSQPAQLSISPRSSSIVQNVMSDTKSDDLSHRAPHEVLPFNTSKCPVNEEFYFLRNEVMCSDVFKWENHLSSSVFCAAPVSCFKHVPVANCWDDITVGMKVEVENTDCDDYSEYFADSFWVASVLKLIGYYALLRYEGFGQDASKDFWLNICASNVHPVGWWATKSRPLIPPKSIERKYKDWKEFLVKRLTGAHTLPSSFQNKLKEYLISRFRCGMNLEVVDSNTFAQVTVAVVKKMVGKRLCLLSYNAANSDTAFWRHEDSSFIHPVGWAMKVGHPLDAPLTYTKRLEEGLWSIDDTTDEYFIEMSDTPSACGLEFQEGMKLEALDPSNFSTLCAATIMKIMKAGYLMVKLENYDAALSGSSLFCYHATSPYILPIGFCEQNSIPLAPPRDYVFKKFSWTEYLRDSCSVAAPQQLFSHNTCDHGFVEGMRLEVANLADSGNVFVGSISRIVRHLLKIHIDDWFEDHYQWTDCCSTDIYPIGWSQVVGIKLCGPRVLNPCSETAANPLNYVPGRKKKRHRRQRNTELSKALNSVFISTAPDLSERSHCLSPDSSECVKTSEPLGVSQINWEPISDIVEGEMAPDQSLLPASPLPSPIIPPQKNTAVERKVIPNNLSVDTGAIEPHPIEWSVSDVAKFLKENNCGACCELFFNKKIDGKRFLALSKKDIIRLTGRVALSTKVHNLILYLRSENK